MTHAKRFSFLSLQAALACMLSGLMLNVAPATDSPTSHTSASVQTAEGLLALAGNLSAPYRDRLAAKERLAELGNAALPALAHGLISNRLPTRQIAARLLGECSSPNAESALLQAAKEENPLLRFAVLDGLARWYQLHPPAVAIACLGKQAPAKTGNASVTSAAQVLQHQAALRGLLAQQTTAAPATNFLSPACEKAVQPFLWHPAPELRREAALLLGHTQTKTLGSLLSIQLKSETVPAVLAALCQSLGNLQTTDAEEPLKALVQHKDPRVALEAAGALLHMGYTGMRDVLQTALSHKDDTIRLRAVQIVSASGDPRLTALLQPVLRDQLWFVRARALRALADKHAVPVSAEMRGLLQDTDARVRVIAAQVLHQRGVAGIESMLENDLTSGMLPARQEAARVLGLLRSQRAQPALEKALGNPDLELACRAADALANLGKQSAVPALAACLPDARLGLSHAARMAIKQLTGNDPGTTPASWRAWAKANNIRLHLPGE